MKVSNSVKILKPYIEEHGDKIRLCANCIWNGKEKLLWYEVDNKYGKYLTAERSDAFVLGILKKAMHEGMDIEFEQPMSEALHYQLQRYLIPVMAQNLPQLFMPIKLKGSVTADYITNHAAVGTGFSGG